MPGAGSLDAAGGAVPAAMAQAAGRGGSVRGSTGRGRGRGRRGGRPPSSGMYALDLAAAGLPFNTLAMPPPGVGGGRRGSGRGGRPRGSKALSKPRALLPPGDGGAGGLDEAAEALMGLTSGEGLEQQGHDGAEVSVSHCMRCRVLRRRGARHLGSWAWFAAQRS